MLNGGVVASVASESSASRHAGDPQAVAERGEKGLQGHGGERVGVLAVVDRHALRVNDDAHAVNQKGLRPVMVVVGLESLEDELFQLTLLGLSQQGHT